jgi:superfamily I DNA and/or RNA helicase
LKYNGIDDKRLQFIEASLGYAVAAEVEKYPETRGIFFTCRKILKEADVIVATCNNTLSPFLYDLISPKLVMLDEANRVSEAETASLLIRYNLEGFIMFGDRHQLPPYNLIDEKEDIRYFKCLNAVTGSLFTRLELLREISKELEDYLLKYFWDEDGLRRMRGLSA